MSKRKQRPQTMTKKPQLSSSGISNTLLDIVIPVRDRFDILEACLDSIGPAFPEIDYNIIIVDNGSDEVIPKEQVIDFYRKVEALYPNLTVIRNKNNPGFAASCNQGARRKNSPILFFLNSDVVLDVASGMELLKSMDDPKTGIAGMKLRFADIDQYTNAGLNPSIRPAGKLQHVGLSVNTNGDIYHPYVGWDVDHERFKDLRVVFAVTGAALMLRRNTFIKAGGFYEGYGLGTFEDVDLCMMVREQGLDVTINQNATAIHYTGATMEQLQTPYPMNQNSGLFRSRWLEKLIWWDFFML